MEEINTAQLFELITKDEDNEDEIIKLIESISKDDIKKVVNTISGDYHETMIMWAVRRLKFKVIIRLVRRCGVDLKYKTKTGESVVTYWDDDAIKKNPDKALSIARFLHFEKVDLSKGSKQSWSLVKRAKENKYNTLCNLFKRLGYT